MRIASWAGWSLPTIRPATVRNSIEHFDERLDETALSASRTAPSRTDTSRNVEGSRGPFRDRIKRASRSIAMAYVATAFMSLSLALRSSHSQIRGILIIMGLTGAVAGALDTWLPVDAILPRAGTKEAHRLRKLKLWQTPPPARRFATQPAVRFLRR